MFCKSEAKTPIKCESDKDSHAIAVFASDLEGDEQISPQVVCASTNVDATTNPSEKTTTLPSKRKLKVRVEKRKKKPVGKKPIGNPAFSSVSQAIRDERLFHSVVQRPLCVTEFENGCDSDDESEDQEERKWRLKQVDEEIEEYVDTIAVEKLFMNLWNQFVTLEHAIIADRYVAPACLQFARSKLIYTRVFRLRFPPTETHCTSSYCSVLLTFFCIGLCVALLFKRISQNVN